MLDKFFSPQSVAVIGASREEGKVGHEILENIIRFGYHGKVFPVNPKAEEIEGHKCYPSVLEIPEAIDLAIIVVPNKTVPAVLEDCGKKKIEAVIIITAGFKEAGREGAKLERQLLEIAQKYRIRILGPNCLGLIDTSSCLNASFAAEMPARGNVALLSQSGALCTAILDWAQGEELGFSKFVSLGNQADLSETDFLEAFNEDEKTEVIAGYIEGVVKGRRFIEVAKRTAKKKPIILIKSGETSGGARAASSHTGSIAGAEQAYEATFKQCGILRARSVQELFDLASTFASQPLPRGRRVAIVTNAGGPGIMATDACERLGLQLASFEKSTIEFLRSQLPPAANFYNPVDVLGDAPAERYKIAIEAVLKDANVDGLIVVLTPQAMTEIEETAKAVCGTAPRYNKPVVACFMGEVRVERGIKILRRHKIRNFPSPERAAAAFVALAKRTEWLNLPAQQIKNFPVDKERVQKFLMEAQNNKRLNLTDLEAREVIAAYGIRVPKSKLAKTVEEAEEAAAEIGYPVAMKIASPDILHKSDIGAVKIGIADPEELRDAFDLITIRTARYMPQAEILGVSVQQMVPRGKEVILGMVKDPQFGPLIMFGLGGIYVEVLKDTSFRIAPLTEYDAREMVHEIRSYPLLTGVRGERPADIDSIVEALLRLSQLVCDFPQIMELDINPLKVDEAGKGAVAIDARITISSHFGVP